MWLPPREMGTILGGSPTAHKVYKRSVIKADLFSYTLFESLIYHAKHFSRGAKGYYREGEYALIKIYSTSYCMCTAVVMHSVLLLKRLLRPKDLMSFSDRSALGRILYTMQKAKLKSDLMT